MIKYLLFFLAVAFSFLLLSCGNEKQKMQNEIEAAEQRLKNDTSNVADKKKVVEAIHLYTTYANQFKDDSISAEYLFRAADLTNGMHQPDKAIELFERVQEYKTYSKTPIALFLQGFIAETEMQNIELAKKYYEKFLAKYPNHQLTDDVRITLANLGKSPDDIIKEFEEKAKLDSLKLSDEVSK